MTTDIAAGRALVVEARASTDGVTEGPWSVAGHSEYGVECGGINAGDEPIVITDSGTYPPSMKDAKFIARSRTMLPQLTDAHAAALDDLEQLRTRVAKLQAVVDALPKCACGAFAVPKHDGVMSSFRSGFLLRMKLVCASCKESSISADEMAYAGALRALEKTCSG
jgi:hypothetical protein